MSSIHKGNAHPWTLNSVLLLSIVLLSFNFHIQVSHHYIHEGIYVSCITRKYLRNNYLLMMLTRQPWPCTLGTSASKADPRVQNEGGLAIFNSYPIGP